MPDPKPKGKGGGKRPNLVVQIRPITVAQIEAGEALIDKGHWLPGNGESWSMASANCKLGRGWCRLKPAGSNPPHPTKLQ